MKGNKKNNLRVGFTYNLKKDVTPGEMLNENVSAENHYGNFVSESLVKKYSERISDKYSEWDDEETITAVESAIKKAGHEVIRVEADDNAYEKLKSLSPDIVFNIAEGFGGASRESHIPAILEMLNIPYTASDPITIGNCHNKARCKEILSYYNIPTPKFFVTDFAVNGYPKVEFPAFVKPLHEGSSKGIYNSSIVNDKISLNKEILRISSNYSQPSIIEDYLDGREFTVALLGNGKNTRVLPIVEINMDTLPENLPKIYSYEVKWYFDTPENNVNIFTCPAKISEKLQKEIEEICLKAYKVLGIRDWARIDVRCDADGNPYIIEVNPLPGILPNPDENSCFPKAARHVGIDYDNLIQTVLNLAIERYGLNNNK